MLAKATALPVWPAYIYFRLARGKLSSRDQSRGAKVTFEGICAPRHIGLPVAAAAATTGPVDQPGVLRKSVG